MFLILWEILCAPIRLVLALASFLAYVCGFIYDVVGNIWLSLSGIIQLTSASKPQYFVLSEVYYMVLLPSSQPATDIA
ncbi:hypothetical protein Gogos_014896 [Gossypium gossypioides]|uniref:Uncharacterized protein n=1 Tax=Gossypium gossypioides TaxID=34282 RepID=A0A7J9C064_GOSGO|nr:hypothetical protein [Gossypium gossypioides]